MKNLVSDPAITFVPKFMITLSAAGFTEANFRLMVLASPAQTTAANEDSTISEKIVVKFSGSNNVLTN